MTKFYRCRHCGTVIQMLDEKNIPTCCGDTMTKLVPGSTDASVEKHVPVVDVKSDMVSVSVGSVMHPMEEAHYIQWIYLETKEGGQIKYLKPDMDATATFLVTDTQAKSVYAYCNLHGLWKYDLKK